jgi:hypothetical protein
MGNRARSDENEVGVKTALCFEYGCAMPGQAGLGLQPCDSFPDAGDDGSLCASVCRS